MQITKLETDTLPLFELSDSYTVQGVFTIKEIREKFCHKVLSTIALGIPYKIEYCKHCGDKCSMVIALGKNDIF